jgi:TatA/E family protein of Tat protein translocase
MLLTPEQLGSAALFSFSDFGMGEILIVLVIVLIVFGPKRLPQLARAMGQSIQDFKKGLHDVKSEIESSGEGDKAGEEQKKPILDPVKKSDSDSAQDNGSK